MVTTTTTKRALIEDLLKAGNTPRAIHDATGISLKHIRNIYYDLNNPGTLKRARGKWRSNHHEKWLKYERETKLKHQRASLQFATKRGQVWTLTDIEYLLNSSDTMRQKARYLGRTFRSIQRAIEKFRKKRHSDTKDVNSSLIKHPLVT